MARMWALTLAGRLGAGPLDVACDEEADEQVRQGREVQDVEPDAEGLAGGGDAGDDLVCVDDLRGGLSGACAGTVGDGRCLRSDAEDKLLEVVEERRTRGGGSGSISTDDACSRCCGRDLAGRGRNRDVVADEGVNHRIGGANEELSDLQTCQGALDDDRHADRECAQRVIGVLCVVNNSGQPLVHLCY